MMTKNGKKGVSKNKTNKQGNSSSVSVDSSQSQVRCSVCDDICDNDNKWLSCDHCGNYMHAACIDPNIPAEVLHYMKSANRFTNLRMFCNTCVISFDKDVISVMPRADEHAAVLQDISGIKQSISELNTKLSDMVVAVNAISLHKDDGSTSVGQVHSAPAIQQSSYASIVAKDLPHIVKTAIAEVIKQQHSEEKDMASLVVYGLRDTGHDLREVGDLLRMLGCEKISLHFSRLGRLAANNTRPRPLKLECDSVGDRDRLLSAAKMRTIPRGISISPWLRPDEMLKVKSLRLRCKELNDLTLPAADGRKPYVVISGRLMVRHSAGKLVPFNDSTSSSSTTTHASTSSCLPGSKNVSGGSR
jgi:hypothetical protein